MHLIPLILNHIDNLIAISFPVHALYTFPMSTHFCSNKNKIYLFIIKYEYILTKQRINLVFLTDMRRIRKRCNCKRECTYTFRRGLYVGVVARHKFIVIETF